MRMLLSVIAALLVNSAQADISPNCRGNDNPHRSTTVLHAFDKATGHPHGWRGHVRDHICPLACGGLDAVQNLQWQTIEEAKAKDRIERTPAGYELYCTPTVGN